MEDFFAEFKAINEINVVNKVQNKLQEHMNDPIAPIVKESTKTIEQMDNLCENVKKTDDLALSFANTNSSKEVCQKCLEVLNWSPPNLLDPKSYPQLVEVGRNSLVNPFLFTINKAVMGCALSVVGITVTRTVFKQLLDMLGGRTSTGEATEISKQLAEVGDSVQQILNIFCKEIESMVLGLAETSKSCGVMSFSLEYGANANLLVDSLDKVENILYKDEANHLKVMDMATKKIDEAYKFLIKNNNGVRTGVIQTLQKRVKDLEKELSKQAEKYKAQYYSFYNKEKEIQCEIKHLQGLIDRDKSQVKCLEMEIQKSQNLEQHFQNLIKNQDMMAEQINKEQYLTQEQVSKETKQNFANNCILDQLVKDINQSFEQRKQSLKKQQDELTTNVTQLTNLESTASVDGKEVRKETEKSGWWIFASERTSVTTIETGNKRIEYTKLLQHKEKQLAELDEILKNLTNEQQQEIIKLQSTANQIKLQQQQQEQDMINNRYENKRDIQNQTKKNYENGLKEGENRTMKLKTDRQSLNDKIIENEKKLENERRKLAILISNSGDLSPERTKLNIEKEEYEECEKQYQEARKTLQEMLKYIQSHFGVQDAYSFDRMVKVLSSFRNHIENVGVQCHSFIAAFRGCKQSFACNYFKEQFNTIPEQNRGKAMKRIADHLQLTSLVGYEALQLPIQAMIWNDLNKLGIKSLINENSNKKKVIQYSNQQSVVIDEIDDKKQSDA